jgi:hypothetical protein
MIMVSEFWVETPHIKDLTFSLALHGFINQTFVIVTNAIVKIFWLNLKP